MKGRRSSRNPRKRYRRDEDNGGTLADKRKKRRQESVGSVYGDQGYQRRANKQGGSARCSELK